jgi:ornithine cyclodeaminase/alanine dehydrogenase-like protein (mu-crystallin family)
MLFLTENDVRQTLTIAQAIDLAETGIRAEGREHVVGDKFYMPVGESGFIKPFAGYQSEAEFAFVKIFSFFDANPERFHLPATSSVVLLFDAQTGLPVCLMQADWVTGLKTCASTTVTAATLAPPDAKVAVIFGAGLQGEMHLRALSERFSLQRASVVDIRLGAAQALKQRLQDELGLDLEVVPLEARQAAVEAADIIVTVTTGDMPLLERSWLKPGAFVARLGSYRELALDVITEADKIVVDRWEYVRDRVPELKELTERKLISRREIYAEWPEIAAGNRPGRESAAEVIVHIALGTWGEYAAILPAVYRRAVEMDLGIQIGSEPPGNLAQMELV